jgi:carbon storage regulator CsrA
MLVLTRRRGESILINGNIKVMYIEPNGSSKTPGNSVLIGVEAPPGITIMREEIADQYTAEGKKKKNE